MFIIYSKERKTAVTHTHNTEIYIIYISKKKFSL